MVVLGRKSCSGMAVPPGLPKFWESLQILGRERSVALARVWAGVCGGARAAVVAVTPSLAVGCFESTGLVLGGGRGSWPCHADPVHHPARVHQIVGP